MLLLSDLLKQKEFKINHSASTGQYQCILSLCKKLDIDLYIDCDLTKSEASDLIKLLKDKTFNWFSGKTINEE